MYTYFPFLVTVWNRRALPQVGHLMDIPPTPDQFPVHISYAIGADRYGTDDGVVTLTEDWLTFQGLESEFSVRPLDVLARYNGHSQDRRTRYYGQWRLVLYYTLGGVPFSVSIYPNDRVHGVEGRFRRAFCGRGEWWAKRSSARIHRTVELNPETALASPNLPTVDPHPSEIANAAKLMALASLFLASTLGVLGLLAWRASAVEAAIAAAGLMPLAMVLQCRAIRRFRLLRSGAKINRRVLPKNALPSGAEINEADRSPRIKS